MAAVQSPLGLELCAASDCITRRPVTRWTLKRALVSIQTNVHVNTQLKTMKSVHVSKGAPRQAEVVQGVPGRLGPRIFSTFRHYKGGRSSAKRTGVFTPGEIPGTHFQSLSRPQGTWFSRGYHGKKSPATPPGIDPGTVRLVAQRLNHYATSV